MLDVAEPIAEPVAEEVLDVAELTAEPIAEAEPVAEEVLAVSFEEGTPATGPGETAYVTGHDAETGLNFALRPVEG